TLLLIAVQWSQIYWQWTDRSFLYSIGSLALLFLLQDAYFYGTHRALHLPFLYKKFHCMHHRSLVLNVWSSFSVHPLEKFIELLFYPLMICAIPLHPLVLMAFLFMSTTINFLGHSGYELKWHPKVKTLPLLYGATTVFHDLHHRSPRYNFGLYFTYLDALFTTEHPNYKNEFHKEVKTGQQSSPMPYLEYE
ncbi:MAG: sterol desaturase family protein, partial [Bdellovibrionales bacterium]|nr:sterol desaturase family protein [Bdellovibrionales bacterium]